MPDIRLLADADFNRAIVAGVLRRVAGLDLVTAQDVGLAGRTPDPVVLEWAAGQSRVVLTHDKSTMPDFAWRRVCAGQPMPGMFVVPQSLAIASAINDIALIAECSDAQDWDRRVEYLPL